MQGPRPPWRAVPAARTPFVRLLPETPRERASFCAPDAGGNRGTVVSSKYSSTFDKFLEGKLGSAAYAPAAWSVVHADSTSKMDPSTLVHKGMKHTRTPKYHITPAAR